MRKALKTVLCVALVLALAVVIALRVLPPMNAPAQSAAATPTPAAAAAPTPTPEPDNGLPKVSTGSWELTLVNAHNSIGAAVPEDLAELEGGRYFDARAVDALKEFIAAARAEGLSVCLSSAYRSYNEQTYLFNRKVSQCGGDEAAAARIVNRPGTSEHQLGLCADITDKFYEVKTQDLEKTALITPGGHEIGIAANPAVFAFIGTIQEETHRFSIDYQRRLRRESLSSELDQIPGVGEKRRNALLKTFRSVKAIRAASCEELCAAVPAGVARAVYDHYHPKGEPPCA